MPPALASMGSAWEEGVGSEEDMGRPRERSVELEGVEALDC